MNQYHEFLPITDKGQVSYLKDNLIKSVSEFPYNFVSYVEFIDIITKDYGKLYDSEFKKIMIKCINSGDENRNRLNFLMGRLSHVFDLCVQNEYYELSQNIALIHWYLSKAADSYNEYVSNVFTENLLKEMNISVLDS